MGGDQTLQLDLLDGADELHIAQRVARLLEERPGYTVDAERLERGEEHSVSERLAQVIAAGRARDICLERVQVTTSEIAAEIEVALEADGEGATGRATGPATPSCTPQTAAAATGQALDTLLGGVAKVSADFAQLLEVGSDQVVVVLATLAIPERAERVTGSALVRGDIAQAAARAMLGALDRRIAPLLAAAPAQAGHSAGVGSKTALVPIVESPASRIDDGYAPARYSDARAIESGSPSEGSGRHASAYDDSPWSQRHLPAPRGRSRAEIIDSTWA
jgi:hypothetical protein